jgi:hypothetical protein
MTVNNRGLAGQPILPYVDNRSYTGADIFIDMTFLDHTEAPVVPTAITYEIDDITNDVSMVPATSLAPNGTSMQTLQIPGAQMSMTYPYQGSQLCQILIKASVTDSVTGLQSSAVAVAVLELCNIQTPGGQG